MMTMRAASLFTVIAVAVCVTASASGAAAAADIGPSQLFARNRSSLLTEITTTRQVLDIVRDRYGTNLVAFYDSADLNSFRHRGALEGGAALLAGFARVYAADVRNPSVAMLASAWTVNTVPWVYGLGAKQHRARTDEFPGLQQQQLGGSVGMRTPVPRSRHFLEVTPAEMRKFGLALVAEADQVITRVETELMLKTVAGRTVLNKDGGATGGRPQVVLFTDKATSSLLYRALAARYVQAVDFYEVNTQKVKSAATTFPAAKKVPALVVFGGGAAEGELYGGALHIEPLSEFVAKFAPPAVLQALADKSAATHNAALQREVRRRQGPLLALQPTLDDWQGEVEQRAGVVGLVFLSSAAAGGGDEARAAAEAAVRALRDKEAAKRTRTNVVQFVALPLSEPRFAKLFAALSAAAGDKEPGAEEMQRTQVRFVSSRKGVVSSFVGALSGDGLHGYMTSELTRGVGAKPIDVTKLRSVFE